MIYKIEQVAKRTITVQLPRTALVQHEQNQSELTKDSSNT